MTQTKALKLVLDDYGSFLGMEKGCFVVKDRNDNVERYPLFEQEIGEVVLKSGNSISTGALASLGFWDVDVLVLTRRGRPVAFLKSLEDDSHVHTRVCQYEALSSKRGAYVAKQLVKAKIQGQNQVLKKHRLPPHENSGLMAVDAMEGDRVKSVRRRLMTIEGHHSKRYFHDIWQLLPEWLRPKARKSFKAYDRLNNLLNLAYEMLKWKVHIALVKAKLEPFLGFLHSMQYAKPSLVCDFVELYRYLLDDFVIRYCHGLRKKDFVTKSEVYRNRRAKREYLSDSKTRDFMRRLNAFFQSTVEVPRIRIGKRQEVETLINEEALLLAKFLRDEITNWVPRIGSV